ncbi:hypothetical protein M9458_021001, partial [Cirrhinus mrigala]
TSAAPCPTARPPRSLRSRCGSWCRPVSAVRSSARAAARSKRSGSRQELRYRWLGTCCLTQLREPLLSLGPRCPLSSVSNRSVWSCW